MLRNPGNHILKVILRQRKLVLYSLKSHVLVQSSKLGEVVIQLLKLFVYLQKVLELLQHKGIYIANFIHVVEEVQTHQKLIKIVLVHLLLLAWCLLRVILSHSLSALVHVWRK